MSGDQDGPAIGMGNSEGSGLHVEVPGASGSFYTGAFLTATSPSPDDTSSFVPRSTPGNVGVCLSGGGSRAFSAGIGQLQALEALQVQGASLLSQTRAISTVSGGGWIGIPFVFRPSTISDSDLLGSYVPPADLTVDGLEQLPPDGIANHITADFSLPALAIRALFLYGWKGVPSSQLWQVLMGQTFLQPYGLYVPGTDLLPTQFFSYDEASLGEIRANNPGLAGEAASLVAQVPGQQRPYLISLSGLSVSVGTQQALLAPVHSTPFVTGVLSSPPGALDTNNRAVGGGAIWSFAFNSAPLGPIGGGLIEVTQSRQWSLTDAMGTSSAAFAQSLIQLMAEWSSAPTRFAAALRLHGPRAVEKLARGPEDAVRLRARLETAIAVSPAEPLVQSDLHRSLQELAALDSIVPQYQYWSPEKPPFQQPVAPSCFADGGSLENTGIAPMLSYKDIDNVIAFLNVETALHKDDYGVIVIDDCVPPLFGYQPYVEGAGYVPYANAANPNQPVFQYNQLFPADQFEALLLGLWNTSNHATNAAVFSQTLTTVANHWFNVAGGKEVTVVWSYLNYANSWFQAIADDWVRAKVDYEYIMSRFPNYATLSPELSATQINLLANFASWAVQDPANASPFVALYAGGTQVDGGGAATNASREIA